MTDKSADPKDHTDYPAWTATYANEECDRVSDLAYRMTEADRQVGLPAPLAGYSATRIGDATRIVRLANRYAMFRCSGCSAPVALSGLCEGCIYDGERGLQRRDDMETALERVAKARELADAAKHAEAAALLYALALADRTGDIGYVVRMRWHETAGVLERAGFDLVAAFTRLGEPAFRGGRSTVRLHGFANPSEGETMTTKITVCDYQTGQDLEGEASDELVQASLAAGDTGAVGAYRDERGAWQYVPEGEESIHVVRGTDVRTVYVDGYEPTITVDLDTLVCADDVADDDEDDDDDSSAAVAERLSHYIAVDVAIDGHIVRVGAMVGARGSDHGSIRAAGCGVRPYCAAWQVDSSDLEAVPAWARGAVCTALESQAWALYQRADRR